MHDQGSTKRCGPRGPARRTKGLAVARAFGAVVLASGWLGAHARPPAQVGAASGTEARVFTVAPGVLAVPALALAQSSGITPGQWEYAVTMTSIDAPGAPAFIAKMMQGKTTRVKHCITPADAARGPQDLMKSNKSCTFTKYSMANGKLSSEMVCVNGGQTTTSVSSGNFTPTSFTSQGRSVTTGGSMPMTVTTTAAGKLIGPCK